MDNVKTILRITGILGYIALTSIAAAHHSPNVHFDRTQTVEFTGELTELIWRNPHVLMTVRADRVIQTQAAAAERKTF